MIVIRLLHSGWGQFTVGSVPCFAQAAFLTRVSPIENEQFRLLVACRTHAAIALATEGTSPPAREAHVPLTIEGHDLGYAYGPEGYAFRHVNLTVAPGETVAIVGPSGCGKTTLIKVLLGLLPPTEGEVRVNGKSLADWDMGQYRARIGAVMQDDHLFVGTIEDNVSFFDSEHDPVRVRECATAAMIDEEIMAMPMGYNTIVGSLGMALSGGRNRVFIVWLGPLSTAQLLFLDESFDQIDVELEQGYGMAFSKALSLIVVSHRMKQSFP